MLEYIINREKRKKMLEEIADDPVNGPVVADRLKNLFIMGMEQQERDLSGMEQIRQRIELARLHKENAPPQKSIDHLWQTQSSFWSVRLGEIPPTEDTDTDQDFQIYSVTPTLKIKPETSE